LPSAWWWSPAWLKSYADYPISDETQKAGLESQLFFILVVDQCMGLCANPRRFPNRRRNHNRGKIINRAMLVSPCANVTPRMERVRRTTSAKASPTVHHLREQSIHCDAYLGRSDPPAAAKNLSHQTLLLPPVAGKPPALGLSSPSRRTILKKVKHLDGPGNRR
jgi:hypothetical protein